MIFSIDTIRNTFLRLLMVTAVILALTQTAIGQEPPPRPIRINATAQILSFGAFYHGASGGTVIIDPSGSRSATGDVILLGMGYSYSPAMFEVHAHRGTVISILNGPPVSLPGSNGGSIQLATGSTIPGPVFVSNVNFNIAIPLYVGGTITVGIPAANPPGTYNGTFNITLVRE
ncbi:MAG: DUF4402 domain-containing protein [Bacteroidales bacterium]|nr:DUF4402 domain-containing protein [Bacteroidales bacterium]